MNTAKPADYEARAACAVPCGRNIIVEAGAGTGKTTILIERLCYLILGRDIPIDKIIALTFTEKAASEIKIRLLSKIQHILAELQKPVMTDETALTLLGRFKKTPQQLQKAAGEAFELAERAQISTIHSFCLQLLRRYPLEAGLAPGAQADGGALLQNIFDKNWAAFLERELTFASPSADDWRAVLAGAELGDIKDYAQTLLTPGFEDYHPLAAAGALREYCLKKARAAAELAQKYAAPKKRAIETAVETAALILEESALFYGSLKPFKSKYNLADNAPVRPKNWDEDDFDEALSVITFARAVKADNQLLILNAFKLLAPFVKAVREEIRKENILSYDDIIETARQLLKREKPVRAELKKEYRSILIDEFQDTDPAQGEILLFLAEAQESAADRWQDIALEQGKLFTVGDPKQSIYRFRGADIAAYQKFTDLMARQNALKCFLRTNFRSSKNIIAFANRFGGAMIKESAGVQPAYVPIENGRVFDAAPVLLAAVEEAPQSKNNTAAFRHNQAQFIAEWIRDNVGRTRLAGGKIMAYKDIAVLLRTAAALDIYTDALKRFDIKYTVEETRNFYTAQEINDIINILKVLYDPYDKTALLGALRSPFAMVSDADILALSQAGALNIFADAGDCAAARRAYEKLRDLYNKSGRMPLQDLIGEIVYNTDFCAAQALASRREQTIANIFKFAAVARAAQGGGALSLGQFLYYAENYSKRGNKEGESPLAEESLDTVSIMTMHKAKGLEFPVVFLADISKKEIARRDKRPQYIYDWAGNTLAARMGPLADGAFAMLEENARTHAAAEELRVLYVALTRAKEKLILAGDLKDDKNTISAALRAAGCWPCAELRPQYLADGDARADICYRTLQPPESFTDKFFGADVAAAAPFDTAAWLEAWRKREAAFDAAAGRGSIIKPADAHDWQGPEPQDNGAAQNAAVAGVLCHRMLLDIFTGAPSGAEHAVAAENIDPRLYTAQIQEAREIIDNFCASPLFAWLKNMRLLAAEMPFTLQGKDGAITSGIMDAVFEEEGGALFIADYKSDNINLAQLAARADFYRPQLDLYKEALAKMCPQREIKAAVIYLRHAKEIYV
ncbi:MAG: UvrD-helicase domain-containing protein [Elusimicrobiota bacterium]|jgi:ATP-dependent helicase/nuclease subunit A|nr:UvrD-helicase domain-containing protein [Elusimicrobiota bacterium]